MIIRALQELGYGKCKWHVRNLEIYENLFWLDNETEKPTEEEIQAKIAELEALEPIRLLRIERNRRLAETDWWAVADRTMTAEQTAYRTALRDLPANSTNVALDEQGNLNNVDWPEVPV